jgi:hypothetical protein
MTGLVPATSEPAATGGSAPLVQTSLVDLLDRLLGTGVVISGDLTICLAGVDLVTVRLRALVSSVGTLEGQ